MDFLTLAKDVGFPIAGAFAAGYFVFLTLSFILAGVPSSMWRHCAGTARIRPCISLQPASKTALKVLLVRLGLHGQRRVLCSLFDRRWLARCFGFKTGGS